ncbi:NAD(P)-dependent malic enzyme [Carnobacterium maltaromaticum]|uniref:NADP-dependent malic enzyme n=1 Tax=Carnobacterium maltaromaticum TaxID=2751 RepID=A0AAW9K4X3_CARML|nr:NADP-dependent malic enzyme [Carnobacterium maltaromaticum]MCC4311254.1 malate dehydrogenase [Carnobacterium maltaromaticum]MDZ5759781.1 NADP-dependent malic enzyme [Carnobacterium maltaromaticum]TFJ70074.1 NAD-dependent malic enzyme [Carnobacterium maltaromaticum]TFJ75993.1 NAD-dependent malic enzyme [Carnobacterium maltaromaticum]CAD5898522.1 NADP-dependent malic enzyme (conversion of malate into pyruvate, anabolic) [Carnobacterium maltaromaticum]
MTDVKAKALAISKEKGGKLEVVPTVPIETMEDLSIAYTPGVAAVCTAIAENPEKVFDYTTKRNMVAVVTDGSAVLGLGNIGPEAAIPVMEGKAALFKRFGNVNAVPISLATQDVEEIISHIVAISPSFGGINLEDISAPRCFEIERRLKEQLDIPVFHDDQHGTAIIVLAALYNGLRLTGKKIDEIHAVVNGGGAAGIAISKMFLAAGVKNLMIVDKTGIISATDENLPTHHAEMAKITNLEHRTGSLEEALKGADVFVGVSAPGALKQEWVRHMNDKAMVFAMANPTPEIFPDEAKAGGAYIVGTGRSDFPNQINNVLAFPGIFRGALDARASDITIEMQIAAAQGIASVVTDEQLAPDYIMPDVFTPGVADIVANSVRKAVK